jgi:oxygen-independent coproporphyrinogen-3 oxidase
MIPSLQEVAHNEPLGLYLHIPFCIDKCTYCSFSSTRNIALKKIVLDQLCVQILEWGLLLGRPIVDTLYMGGGTPSLLSVAEMCKLSDSINRAFDLSTLVESTVEVNPGTISIEWLRSIRALGWDRLSIGVQTLDDTLLCRLGRRHNAQVAVETISLARDAGFDRVSSDLIIGVPGQDFGRVTSDVETLVVSGINHISIYLLDLDKNCVLRTQIASGRLIVPTDDEIADTFEVLQESLPQLGLLPYEISNYAVCGQNSKHNTRYWERRPYLGIGPSAASQLGAWRWTEAININAWIKDKGTCDIHKLNAVEMLAEIPMLGLRMHSGVNWNQLQVRSQALNLKKLVDSWEEQLLPMIDYGLLVKDGPMLRLTSKGMLLSNRVFQIFI